MRDERRERGRMEGEQKECDGNGGKSFVNCMYEQRWEHASRLNSLAEN